jgi:hypothetical protein
MHKKTSIKRLVNEFRRQPETAEMIRGWSQISWPSARTYHAKRIETGKHNLSF